MTTKSVDRYELAKLEGPKIHCTDPSRKAEPRAEPTDLAPNNVGTALAHLLPVEPGSGLSCHVWQSSESVYDKALCKTELGNAF